MADTHSPTRTRPLLRGVSHEIAAGVALAGLVALVLLAPGPRARMAALVYGFSLVALFSVSALYHRPAWSPRALLWMRRLDHSAIFLLIAGTFTPMCLLLGDAFARTMLAVVWAGAGLGILRALLWPRAPRGVATALYLLLWWAAVPLAPAMYRALGPGSMALLAAGGLLYSVGAVIYATRRPDPFPRVFGYHEVFHALVIAAAGLHYAVAAGAVRALAG
ncbi:MAG: hemolysin III family protein [Deltaproteobacteria bacterium]|nr:hemolysin III family protein [Deltaproteobacteria bacterium]